MIIDCVSDLHGHPPKLKCGDLLIVAGDLTAHDEPEEHDEFEDWIREQRYRKAIVIAGNHDNKMQKNPDRFFGAICNYEYLCDSGTEFDGLKIWGSPWTAWFHGINPKCKAFTKHSDEDLAKKWALIPNDIDILITHSPPFGFMDEIFDHKSESVKNVGSISLHSKVLSIVPKLHVFGHIHEGYGIKQHHGTILVNASHVTEGYEPLNKPIRVIL